MKKFLVLTCAGQIGLAISRRIGTGMKIVVSDKSASNAASAALLLNNAGFDAVELSCDISSKESVAELIKFAKNLGPITAFVNAAGVSPPSSGSISTAQPCCWKKSEKSLNRTASLSQFPASQAIGCLHSAKKRTGYWQQRL